ncbi:hypothetical protein AAVH_16384 [Aphelenchoides avenae]|nr:hypothetical protein AAVH_16384 [Aphelenchus avenae]
MASTNKIIAALLLGLCLGMILDTAQCWYYYCYPYYYYYYYPYCYYYYPYYYGKREAGFLGADGHVHHEADLALAS